MFVHELDDNKLIAMAKEYCLESPNEIISSNMEISQYIQVDRDFGKGVFVHTSGVEPEKCLNIDITDYSVSIYTGGASDDESATKSHLKNMLREFGMEFFADLNMGIKTGKIKNIDLKTLYTIFSEVQQENQETPGM